MGAVTRVPRVPRLSSFRGAARAIGLLVPPVRRLHEQRDELRRQLAELEEKHAETRRELSEVQQRYGETIKWGTPTYDSDYLRVWNKNTDFLRDEEFMRAYKAGVHSGHKLGRAAGLSEDIHIEWRILVCCWAAWHVTRLEGDLVECGTNTGIMSLAICNYIDFTSTGKAFYLFDTFCGIPEEQMLPEERAA